MRKRIRRILEGDPHSILEGMMIAGYAIGASEGYVTIRGEYQQARARLEKAIAQAHGLGLLGQKIFGTDFSCEVNIHSGAGATICGEETALIESRRVVPRRAARFCRAGPWGRRTRFGRAVDLRRGYLPG